MRKTRKGNWTNFDGLDVELFVVTEILRLKSLHYGFWKPQERLTLENLGQAQTRYTDTLLEMIPPGVQSILDVGAGIGDNAQALQRQGYNVTAISPDRNHFQYYEKMLSPQLRFVPCRFESFVSPCQYDLVLMSESQSYFDMDEGFKQCNKLLRWGGYLLVSGMFRRDEDQLHKSVRNYYDFDTEIEYKTRAGIYGLHLIRYVDITPETLPTLALAFNLYCSRIAPSLAVMKSCIKSGAGWRWTLLKFILRNQIRRLQTIEKMYEQRLNPKIFLQRARYVRMLFQLRPDLNSP